MPVTARAPRRAVRKSITGIATAAIIASGLTVVAVNAPGAAAASVARDNAVRSASNYAKAHGYKVGIAVLDTKTGQLVGNSSKRTTFASESVIKVLIAARLLVQGRMHGRTSSRARTMIKCSNDNIANSFYGSVGGDSLVSWAKKKFKVPTLGSGPIRGNWWGSNRITAEGLVRLYAKLKADKRIGKWLLSAMHAHTKRGCDGFNQTFGLPRASKNVAVKQGWGSDYSYRTPNASQNSTGFVNGDRYAIAILARGRASTYGSKLGNAITAVAKRLLPRGVFPSNPPAATSISIKSGPATGGTRVAIHGRDLLTTRSVYFGSGHYPSRVTVASDGTLLVTVPKHPAGRVRVYVFTRYGRSSGTLLYTYTAAPKPTPKPTPPPTTTPPSPPPTSPSVTSPASAATASN